MLALLPRGTAYVLLFAVLVFVGFHYVPIYVHVFQFDDFVRQQVKFAGSSKRSIATVTENILFKAEELGLPVEDDNIKVTRDGPFFTVDLSYKVPVDLRIYQHELEFESSLSGQTFAQ